jgi:hypothetical protein
MVDCIFLFQYTHSSLLLNLKSLRVLFNSCSHKDFFYENLICHRRTLLHMEYWSHSLGMISLICGKKYSEALIPKCFLTYPSISVHNDRLDNANWDLILFVNVELVNEHWICISAPGQYFRVILCFSFKHIYRDLLPNPYYFPVEPRVCTGGKTIGGGRQFQSREANATKCYNSCQLK